MAWLLLYLQHVPVMWTCLKLLSFCCVFIYFATMLIRVISAGWYGCFDWIIPSGLESASTCGLPVVYWRFVAMAKACVGIAELHGAVSEAESLASFQFNELLTWGSISASPPLQPLQGC